MNLESIKTTTTWKEAVEGINGNNAKINEAIINLENGSGGSGGVADSVAWEDVTDKPEWLTDTKPVYSKIDLDTSVQTSLDKADTALQTIPDVYATESEVLEILAPVLDLINTKVDKVEGKQLSTEDFTAELKAKLAGLTNYDDAELSQRVTSIEEFIMNFLTINNSDAIENFTEIINFLQGVTDTENLADIISSIESQISSKQAKINDLSTIRSGAQLGATAVQPESLGVGTGLTLNNLTYSVKYGTSAGTACQGNDARLSDARKADGGNADTVNKYSIRVGTTAGTDSSTIYFVI